jgi:N-acetylmuramoyl-L-alanine amidase
MRKIEGIVIHCSATPEGKVFTAADIDKMHRQRGFASIGYHRVIRLDGTVEQGRPDIVPGAHVSGHNFDTLGIVYIGGLDKNGKAKDTRTQAQKQALKGEILRYRKLYSGIRWVKGHRDLSPDKNKNGKIEKHEWLKDCPCFSVEDWMIEVGI